MSTSTSEQQQCSSPNIEQQTNTEMALQMGQEFIANGIPPPENEVQMEFLQFLRSLDEDPNDDIAIESLVEHVGSPEEEQSEWLELEDLPCLAPSILSANPTRLELQHHYQALVKHNFVHKVYLAATTEQVKFLSWSADGQRLQVDYIGLQEHLSDEQNIFCSQSIQQFTRQLLDVGFERVAVESNVGDSPQLHFKHRHCQLDQLEPLLRMTSKAEDEAAIDVEPDSSTLLLKARSRFEIYLSYHNDGRLLQEREPTAEQMMPRRGRISSSRQTTQPLVPALATKLVNPRDSVLHFEPGKVPEYAGFYGRMGTSLVNEFFAEYLPRYGSKVQGYKDIIVDASKANAFQQNLPIGLVYSEDEDEPNDMPGPSSSVPPFSLDPVQPAGTHNTKAVTQDIELEQVMQELCGLGYESAEDDEAKEVVPVKPKLKRKKLLRKCTMPDKEQEPDAPHQDNEDELVQLVALAKEEPKTNDEPNEERDNDRDTSNSKDDDKDFKCQTAPKASVKRRRYDLRNSKAKRTR